MTTVLWIVTGSLTVWVIYLIRRLNSLQASRLTTEEQYETIFKTVTDGLIINALDGTVAEANPAACEMHGYSREEFIGQSAAEFVHPDSLHLFSEYVEALSAGRSFHCFAQDLRKDGSVFDVEVNGIPFQFKGQPHLLGIVRDITERKGTEDALKRSEEINRQIVEAVPGGIVHVAPNGAILNANRVAQEFLGLSRDELTQQFVQNYDSHSIYEDGSVCETADFPVSKCLNDGGKHGPLTLGVHRPDGTIAWAMFVAVPLPDPNSQQPNGAIVTFLDISDRKKTEQKLSESEHRFRLLAENVPGVIYLCQNDERYRMIYISEAVKELTGYSDQEFLDDKISFVELYHSDDHELIVAEVEAALNDRRPFRLRYRIWHRSGEFRWIDEVGIGVWRDGELAYLEGVLNDVTDLVLAEEKLKAAQKALIEQQEKENERVTAELDQARNRLVQSTRLATIGKMAAQIAHEIRNPLGVIKNSAFFVHRKLPSNEAVAREHAQLIQHEVAMCVDIIENILSITKITPPRKIRFDLEPFVADAFERLRQNVLSADRADSLKCAYEGPPSPFSLFADTTQFRLVLDNLLKNAVEAMTDPGEIRISARHEALETVIDVTDDGPGVPEDHAETIFDLFQTSKAKGTGLGLGICRQIIERHGGTLEVTKSNHSASQQPTGATFRIKIPRQIPNEE